ncbi:hypothetical protein AOLI_G00196340 [Acnodon oligacanthus]
MLYWGFSPTKERPEAQHMKCAVDLQGGKKTFLVGYGVNMSVNLKERHISRWIGVSFIILRSLHTGQSEGASGPREGRGFVFKSCAAALARKPRLAGGCVLVVLLD